jgi:hypothetical protein
MYAAIRSAQAAPSAAPEIAHRIERSFLPTVSSLPGFQGYYVVTTADDVVTTISLFDNQASVEESSRRASAWVAQNLSGLVVSPLHVTAGEVAVKQVA